MEGLCPLFFIAQIITNYYSSISKLIVIAIPRKNSQWRNCHGRSRSSTYYGNIFEDLYDIYKDNQGKRLKCK